MERQIAKILGAEIITYRGTGDVVAYVRWRDDDPLWPKDCTTEGSPKNAHMAALLDRARREGVIVEERVR